MKEDSDTYLAWLEDIRQAHWGRICVIASSFHVVSLYVVYWIIGRRSKVGFHKVSSFQLREQMLTSMNEVLQNSPINSTQEVQVTAGAVVGLTTKPEELTPAAQVHPEHHLPHQ